VRLVPRGPGQTPSPSLSTAGASGTSPEERLDCSASAGAPTGTAIGAVSPSRLTVLGSCGGWPEAGRACSGYLLEHLGVRVVLDLGTGTASRLFGLLGGRAPDAVVITHAHPDHASDLHALFRWLRFGIPGSDPLPVFAAAGVAELTAAMDPPDAAAVPGVLDFRPLPAGPYSVGPLVLTSRELPHYVPNAGVRVEGPGLSVAYTGDTGPDPAVALLGRDVDLFVVDCTDRGVPGLNLSAREAGAFAASAGARRLLLTHFWPGADRSACRAAAAEQFPGEILVAEEGLEIAL
jgi:ribonuclease BN (tRNA processing enzyme)